jgi:hypothetical protein
LAEVTPSSAALIANKGFGFPRAAGPRFQSPDQRST